MQWFQVSVYNNNYFLRFCNKKYYFYAPEHRKLKACLLPWLFPCGWACLVDLCPPLFPPCWPAESPSRARSRAGPRPGPWPLAESFLLFLLFNHPKALPRERVRFFRPLLPFFSRTKMLTTSWGSRSPNPSESRFDMPLQTGAMPWEREKKKKKKQSSLLFTI